MRRTALILPVVLAVFLGGCSLPFIGSKTDNSLTAEEKQAQQEILANCPYDEAICQYMAAQMGAYKHGLTLTTTSTYDGETVTSKTMMDGSGNIHSISTTGEKESSEMILLNGATYIKDLTDGSWMKMPADPENNDSESFSVSNMMDEMKAELESDEYKMVFTKVGEESCGEMAPTLTCGVYTMMEAADSSYSTKMWIDTKEHLARKMETSMGDDSTSTIYYSYESVTITEPSPVKEFSMPSFDTGSGMPSQEDIEGMMENYPNMMGDDQ